MTYLKWIYARIGQMFCFGVGVGLIGNGSEYADITKVAAGAALLGCALVLRQQMLARQ